MAWVRLLTVLMVLAALSSGCTYDRREPGLFGRLGPTPAQSLLERPPGNPDLPVTGEALWTSGEGLGVTVRIAVHAVRRIPGGTVLDWSVTPLSAAASGGAAPAAGDLIPPTFDLGLSRFGDDNVNIALLDTARARVYRPLVRNAPGVPECLCTPLRLAQLGLEMQRTTLLQVAFGPLPDDVRTIDVDISTVPIFSRVPVTAPGLVPLPSNPADLGRPAAADEALARTEPFSYGPGGQRFAIAIDRIEAAPSFTAISWTIESLDRGPGLEAATSPPIASDPPPDPAYNLIAASGPRLRVGLGPEVGVRLAQGSLFGRPALECLCTDLRTWPTAMQRAGSRLNVVSNLPPLARGTTRATVVLPGLTPLTDLPVVAAPDASFRAAGPAPYEPRPWAFRRDRPQTGWWDVEWPTPVPAPGSLRQFRTRVDRLVR